MSERMKICLASDANYMQHLVVTMSSILMHAEDGDELEFLILTDGSIEQAELTRLVDLGNAKLQVINADEHVHNRMKITINPKWPIAIYYRLLLPSLFDDQRIIYLDCDIVVRTSLRPLWELPMEGVAIAGVPDAGFPHKERLHEHGFSIDGEYLNSGVLVLNLEFMRKNGFEERLASVCAAFETPDFPDQDWINVMFSQEKIILPMKWNAMSHMYSEQFTVEPGLQRELQAARKDPAVCHFTNIKPWTMTYTAHPFWGEYWQCLSQTGYANLKYKGWLKRMFMNKPDSLGLRFGRMLKRS